MGSTSGFCLTGTGGRSTLSQRAKHERFPFPFPPGSIGGKRKRIPSRSTFPTRPGAPSSTPRIVVQPWGTLSPRPPGDLSLFPCSAEVSKGPANQVALPAKIWNGNATAQGGAGIVMGQNRFPQLLRSGNPAFSLTKCAQSQSPAISLIA
jgi:hypothetical protein